MSCCSFRWLEITAVTWWTSRCIRSAFLLCSFQFGSNLLRNCSCAYHCTAGTSVQATRYCSSLHMLGTGVGLLLAPLRSSVRIREPLRPWQLWPRAQLSLPQLDGFRRCGVGRECRTVFWLCGLVWKLLGLPCVYVKNGMIRRKWPTAASSKGHVFPTAL
jgi:hypothetical protein